MADAILKTCAKCGFERTLDSFRPDKRGSDGYWPRCMLCEPYGNRASSTCGSCGQRKPMAGKCEACIKRNKAMYRERHREKLRASAIEYNRGRMERTAPERAERRERSRLAAEANRRRIKSEWKLRNPGCVNASTAQRFAAKMRATPAWADRKLIEAVYVRAASLGMQVDHIVPLRSQVVCGLHCEANMQLLAQTENIRKGNRYWPDMWDQMPVYAE